MEEQLFIKINNNNNNGKLMKKCVLISRVADKFMLLRCRVWA